MPRNKIIATLKCCLPKTSVLCIVFISIQFTVVAQNKTEAFFFKLTPSAKEAVIKNKRDTQGYIVSGSNVDSLLKVVEKFVPPIRIITIDKPSRSMLINTSAKFISEKLRALKEVIFIDVAAEPHTETGIIGYNRSFHGISAVDYLLPGANGSNITVGVKEQKMEEADLDLYKRVKSSSLSSGNVTSHATVISSIIGGAGNSFYDGRGIANGCSFFPSSFSNLFADDAAVLNTNSVTVQNHSYGTVSQSFYGAEAVSYDAQTWANKNIVHIFSAGNQGTASPGNGTYSNIPGFANLTGNFKMAKNIITVGAIDNKSIIPAESSSGPLHDGRLAPQLIALGPNGTSDAAAVVSGTVAVMQQVYADSNSRQLPPASLIKAVLFNTAEDVHRTGIDYKTGYGLLNSLKAIKAIQQKEYDGASLSQGQQWTKNIFIPANTAQLKLTLAWTDTTASINNSKALVNDLDIELTHIGSGTVYRPWVLSAAPNTDSLNKLPVRKRDSLNNAEQISIELPAAGAYQVRVMATAISTASQSFHISFHTDTLNTFQFISPNHASDINRDENPLLDIRWRTFVADTNTTGNLYISYNNGANWQLLKTAHKIYTNLYQWAIKDTASTAQLKMETPFGDFFSRSFIISPVIRPKLDFLCTDSLGFSWNSHMYANAYRIYALTDSAYLKPVLTVSTTSVVLKRSQYPSLVYAVEPVLNNGLPAARSIAQNITLQGINCFYKALNYVLIDSNSVRLSLELSTTYSVDSISFEHITQQGRVLNQYGARKITNGVLLYQQLVNSLPPGINYFRGRIKLNNGAVLYTDTVSILSSGENSLWIYPNPARSNTVLSFMLRNQSRYFQLQLIDLNGRMIKRWEIAFAGTIQLPVLPGGVYLFRLTDEQGKAAGSSKLVIY
jgi:hypothetical protein